MLEDTPNPYKPTQTPLSSNHGRPITNFCPKKARPLFRIFAGFFGALMAIGSLGRFEAIGHDGIVITGLMMAVGVQFIIAALTGHWYSWSGRRL